MRWGEGEGGRGGGDDGGMMGGWLVGGVGERGGCGWRGDGLGDDVVVAGVGGCHF